MPTMTGVHNESWQLSAPLVTLWRSDQRLQLGLEPPGGVLIDQPAPGMEPVIEALVKPRTRDELLHIGGQHADHWLDRLLGLLQRSDLLHRPAADPGPVAVIGRGRLATLIAELLLQQMSTPVRLVWPGASGTPRAVLGLQNRYPDRLQYAGHWGYRAAGAGITVVAAQAAEADRSILSQLVTDGQPFLVVRASDLGATVGPLVAPGRSPCHRCEDLNRAAADPAWPRLLAQLCRERAAAPRLQLAWAASTGALHALGWLEGALPDSLGAALELTADRHVRVRPVRAHPACGCLDYG
ncbi:hypothetical protein [Micropruina sp.]|uniref:hypothetical protein n=1 Tax=Micropruina sp. TaxID=2737536 RepID=UPI0039E634F2